MAEMASWFEPTKGKFIFLMDDDILAYHDMHGEDRRNIDWNNFVGHYGIMKVFKVPDRYTHHEGFVNMPNVIRKAVAEGKMDMMFAHANNIDEATPEFIPVMRRLANRFSNVERCLARNPYRNMRGRITLERQMAIGVKHGFKGSTIGQLLRHGRCSEKAMLIALEGATDYMDEHEDHHHYHNIINNPNVTKNVLNYMLKHIRHADVKAWAKSAMERLPLRTVKVTKKSFEDIEVKVTKRTTGAKVYQEVMS